MIPVVGVGVLCILFFIFSPRETPTTVGTQFMDALARGDAKKLTELSYLSDGSKDELQKQWEYSVTYGKYYYFKWEIKGEIVESDTMAKVRMAVDVGKGYDEEYELPLDKQDGHWRVDVYGLSRSLYPGLPRRS